jgi:hypothetical protein
MEILWQSETLIMGIKVMIIKLVTVRRKEEFLPAEEIQL